jgi:hypothetical protein
VLKNDNKAARTRHAGNLSNEGRSVVCLDVVQNANCKRKVERVRIERQAAAVVRLVTSGGIRDPRAFHHSLRDIHTGYRSKRAGEEGVGQAGTAANIKYGQVGGRADEPRCNTDKKPSLDLCEEHRISKPTDGAMKLLRVGIAESVEVRHSQYRGRLLVAMSIPFSRRILEFVAARLASTGSFRGLLAPRLDDDHRVGDTVCISDKLRLNPLESRFDQGFVSLGCPDETPAIEAHEQRLEAALPRCPAGFIDQKSTVLREQVRDEVHRAQSRLVIKVMENSVRDCQVERPARWGHKRPNVGTHELAARAVTRAGCPYVLLVDLNPKICDTCREKSTERSRSAADVQNAVPLARMDVIFDEPTFRFTAPKSTLVGVEYARHFKHALEDLGHAGEA